MKEVQEMQIFNNLFGHYQNYETIFFLHISMFMALKLIL